MIKPLDNYVLLEEEVQTTLESGIILADDVNLDKPNIGRIVAVGPDVKKVKVKDEVLFLYHLFFEVTLDKKKYLFGKDEGIVAKC